MRIATSTISESIVRQIQKLGSDQARWQTQVATNQRIFQAEDDPAAMGRLLNLESERSNIAQYARNADRAQQISTASFSGLTEIKKISDRITELGVLGAGVIGSESFQAYASEANQLLEQALQLGNSRFGNDYIYAGTAIDAAPYVATRDAQGKITGISYAGNSGQTAIALSETATLAPGTSGATNGAINDFLGQMIAMRDALLGESTTAVNAAQSDLIDSENVIVSAMAEHGGIEMRIEINQSQQTARSAEVEKLVSNEADSDLASSIVKLNQTKMAYEAALQSAANIMQLSLLDYLK